MNIQIKYLSFTMVPEAGLIIKIEKISKNASSLSLKKNIVANLNRKFQFYYSLNAESYIGEINEGQGQGQYSKEMSETDYLKRPDLSQTNRDLIMISTNKVPQITNPPISNSVREEKNVDNATPSQNELDNEIKNRKNYADNIHILRLFENVIREIDEMRTEEKEEIEQLEQRENESVFNKAEDKDDYNDDKGFEVKSIFKSRKQFFDVINQHTVPKVIKNLKWGGNILVICLIIIAFASHFVSVIEFQEITETLNLKFLQDRTISEFIYIVENIQYLILLNQGLFGSKKTILEQQYKNEIIKSLTLIENIQNTFQISRDQISEKQKSLLTTDTIEIFFNSSSSQFFDLNQASQQLISKSFNVINLNLSAFSLDEPNIFFVMYNMFNDYHINMKKMSDYYVNDLNYKIEHKKSIFLILLIMSVLLNFAAIIILIPLVLEVTLSKDKILTLFLDIPPRVLKKLCLKCENFLTNLQVGEEDDIASERSEAMLDEEDDDNDEASGNSETDAGKVKKRRRRKKTKNGSRGQKKFYLMMILGVLIFEIYFGMNYFFSEKLINGLVPLIAEANDTSNAESVFSFYLLALR